MPLKKSNGAVLIEVLLAIVILSISLTLIIQSLMSSLRAIVYSGDYTEAVFLIDNKMFDLISRKALEMDFSEEDQFLPPLDDYRYRIASHDIPADREVKSINEISLDVVWTAGKRNKNLSIRTYLFYINEDE